LGGYLIARKEFQMFKKEKKAKDIEHKNVLVGRVGLSQMNVSIMPEGDIHLQEFFIDPDYVHNDVFGSPRRFSVIMHIRKEYVPQLLRILLSCGFEAAQQSLAVDASPTKSVEK